MKINTKQEFVNYTMKKFEKLDSNQSFLFPTKLFEEIASDISYILGGDITEKQVLDILVKGEYKSEDMITTASYITLPPTKKEILAERIILAGKCWELRVL